MKILKNSFAITKPHVLTMSSSIKTLFLISLTLAFFLSSSRAQAFECTGGPGEIKVSQCEALKKLYFATDGPNWDYEWPDGPRCGTGGIQCNGNNVIGIYLSNVGMKNELPQNDCFSELPFLENIDMYFNLLEGRIPDEIAELEFLEKLYLGRNKLTGEIPEQLLGYNADPSRHHVLDLSHNDLWGPLPDYLGSDEIDALWVENNSMLRGPIPGIYKYLNDMSILNYENTQICEPQDPGMQDWLNGLDTHIGTDIPCDKPKPAPVDASDGTSDKGIIVKWGDSIFAQYYLLYRADGIDPGLVFVNIEGPLHYIDYCSESTCEYFDKNVKAEFMYTYGVVGCTSKHECGPMETDAGYKKRNLSVDPLNLLLLIEER